jgi:diguanylate cyclase (GGDEF)-like protein
VYLVGQGTLVCVPLVALGETVGAVHLHWSTPRELSLPLRLAITRVAEHAALSIANRRLLLALRGQANTDARTGLTNNRSFDETAERILANRGARDPVSILMLDLDHFKDFNDRFGHPAGDEALRAFAHLLTSCIRDEDVAARYGGEEFAVCLPGTNAAAAAAVAERIRERTETTIIPLSPGLTGHITVSIGIATAPADGVQLLALLKAADEALYRAKLAGRNRVVPREAGPSPSANGNGRAAASAGTPTLRKQLRKPPSEPNAQSA